MTSETMSFGPVGKSSNMGGQQNVSSLALLVRYHRGDFKLLSQG